MAEVVIGISEGEHDTDDVEDRVGAARLTQVDRVEGTKPPVRWACFSADNKPESRKQGREANSVEHAST